MAVTVFFLEREGSLAYRFNTEHQADMSEMKEVFEDALQVSKDSQGAFDLTVLPLSQLWNFDKLGDSDFDVSTMKSRIKKILHRQ